MTRRAISKLLAAVIVIIVVVGVASGAYYFYYSAKTKSTGKPTSKATVPATTPSTTTTHTTSLVTSTKASHTATTTTTTATTTTSSATTHPQGGITVTDFRGEKIVLKHPAKRVVVIESYWAEVLQAIGAGNTIVGVGKYVKYDEYLPAYIRSKPAVGSVFSGVNIEEVVALKPDVVIMDIGYGKSQYIASKLQQEGIQVIGMFIHSFKDELRAIKLLGEVTGHTAGAENLIKFLSSHYDKLLDTARTIKTRLTAVMISGYSLLSGKISLYSNTSWGHALVDAGLINLALKHFPKQDWPKIDFETLVKWDPDVIFITSSVQSIPKVIELINSSPKWHVLKAYKAGRVYIVPCWASIGGVLDWGPRDIIGREYIASLAYPSKFSAINWRQDAEYLLSHFYGEFIPVQAFASYSIRWMEVVDLTGEAVKLPPIVSRAVDMISYTTLVALHVMNKVVGISRFAKTNPLMLKAYPNVTKIPSPGSSFSMNIEELLALRPQVVIMWPFKSSLVKEIEDKGIPVVKVWCYSYHDIERLIWLFGTIFNAKERAYELISSMNDIISLVKSKTANIPQSERVKVLYLWSKPTMVQGGRGDVNDFINLAGGVNVAAADYPNRDYVSVNLEKIISWNPQVIIIWYYARYTPEDILKNPAWKAVAAVKAGRVFKEPFCEHWGVSASILVLWMSMKLYPNLWKGYNFTSIADKYFKEWYGISYSGLK